MDLAHKKARNLTKNLLVADSELDFLSSAPVYLLGLTHKCVMPSNIKDQLGYLQAAYV